MKQTLLTTEEILQGYDAISRLYPYIPSMIIWRAWEYAAYRHFRLAEPVLDVGCGSGDFFRLAWPDLQEIVGVDIDRTVVDLARQSGIYKEVHLAPADQLPVVPGTFMSAFANCSLEHMDNLPGVLANVNRSLQPGGGFLLSVVTDKFLKWTALPLLVEQIGEPAHARSLQEEYEDYHHLVNPLPVESWIQHLEQAGFEIVEHLPIVPEITSRLWHVRQPCGELGDRIYRDLRGIKNFTQAFPSVLAGVLQMEDDWSIGSGAVFWVRRR
jgi:SAM-dependent methyltransferase